jgi:hypothetical protein
MSGGHFDYRQSYLGLYKLEELLREYDLAVSGDSSEKDFLERARSLYGNDGAKIC